MHIIDDTKSTKLSHDQTVIITLNTYPARVHITKNTSKIDQNKSQIIMENSNGQWLVKFYKTYHDDLDEPKTIKLTVHVNSEIRHLIRAGIKRRALYYAIITFINKSRSYLFENEMQVAGFDLNTVVYMREITKPSNFRQRPTYLFRISMCIIIFLLSPIIKDLNNSKTNLSQNGYNLLGFCAIIFAMMLIGYVTFHATHFIHNKILGEVFTDKIGHYFTSDEHLNTILFLSNSLLAELRLPDDEYTKDSSLKKLCYLRRRIPANPLFTQSDYKNSLNLRYYPLHRGDTHNDTKIDITLDEKTPLLISDEKESSPCDEKVYMSLSY